LEKLLIVVFLKKNIYKTNNIQKVLMPLMAKYTRILKRISGIFDSIFVENWYLYLNLIFQNLIKELALKISSLADGYQI